MNFWLFSQHSYSQSGAIFLAWKREEYRKWVKTICIFLNPITKREFMLLFSSVSFQSVFNRNSSTYYQCNLELIDLPTGINYLIIENTWKWSIAVLVKHNTQQIFIKGVHAPGRREPGAPRRQQDSQQEWIQIDSWKQLQVGNNP